MAPVPRNVDYKSAGAFGHAPFFALMESGVA